MLHCIIGLKFRVSSSDMFQAVAVTFTNNSFNITRFSLSSQSFVNNFPQMLILTFFSVKILIQMKNLEREVTKGKRVQHLPDSYL
jgi:hypothetical protein